jgi:drug/metabolite transporter (DMT)-like permease
MNTTAPRLDLTSALLLLFLSVLWGASFLFAKIAVGAIPVFVALAARVMIGAASLGLYLIVTRHELPRELRIWRMFLFMGVFNNAVPFALLFWAQTEITAGLGAILNAMTPIFTLIVAHFLTRDEKITRDKLIGIGIGFCGVAVLVGPSLLLDPGRAALAKVACIVASVSYGFASVFGRRFAREGVSPLSATFGQIVTSSLVIFPIALFFHPVATLAAAPVEVYLALLGLGIVSTAFAYVLFYKILARAGATNVSLVTLLVPVSATILGALVLDETLTPMQGLGMALISIGLLVMDGRAVKAIRNI